MAIAFLFLLIFSRFFYIQVIWSDELKNLASDQWTREIPVVAERGSITDRNGTVLAGNVTSYSVFAAPTPYPTNLTRRKSFLPFFLWTKTRSSPNSPPRRFPN